MSTINYYRHTPDGRQFVDTEQLAITSHAERGQMHADRTPAVEMFSLRGDGRAWSITRIRIWAQHGKIHRSGAPAVIIESDAYNPVSDQRSTYRARYRMEHGQLHHAWRPAFEDSHGYEYHHRGMRRAGPAWMCWARTYPRCDLRSAALRSIMNAIFYRINHYNNWDGCRQFTVSEARAHPVALPMRVI